MSAMPTINLKTLSPNANAIRALAMDAVQKANSGHPGAPMGMADIAEVLWRNHLKHNPKNPKWCNRDRFVLSNGHGSMLLYALLHLSGYDLSMDEIKNFRQMGSLTPGHPEYGLTPGAETTTGPLGQGVSNAVGMALAEKMLAAQFNQSGHTIVDHHTYVFAGDGCLMEGVSHEACSLAGTWGLNKLIVFYDANDISIDGDIKGWFTDNTRGRFESYGWNVIGPINGHDSEQINTAILSAQSEKNKPTLIICKTLIGCGSPNKQGSADTHGSPLGADEIAATRMALDWHAEPFTIPVDIAKAWSAIDRGTQAEASWNKAFADYQKTYPDLAKSLVRRFKGELPDNFADTANALIDKAKAEAKSIASRKASEMCLSHLVPAIPELAGGSADLACSNLTDTKHSVEIMDNMAGNRISFGVREFGMAAIANGISLHGAIRPFVATFLVFSDYARNAIRMAALMHQPIIYVFTHDSIGLGEDGPTHQPIEHIPSLRMIPNLNVWRPCDAVETAVAWREGLLAKTTPTLLALSRQALAPQPRNAQQEASIAKGGYILRDAPNAQAVIIATGSEVDLAMKAVDSLAVEGVSVRVVSMPCAEIFAKQDKRYIDSVLPSTLPRVAVEASHSHYWKGWVGINGEVVGMTSFGESAPAGKLFEHFGITAEKVAEAVKRLV